MTHPSEYNSPEDIVLQVHRFMASHQKNHEGMGARLRYEDLTKALKRYFSAERPGRNNDRLYRACLMQLSNLLQQTRYPGNPDGVAKEIYDELRKRHQLDPMLYLLRRRK